MMLIHLVSPRGRVKKETIDRYDAEHSNTKATGAKSVTASAPAPPGSSPTGADERKCSVNPWDLDLHSVAELRKRPRAPRDDRILTDELTVQLIRGAKNSDFISYHVTHFSWGEDSGHHRFDLGLLGTCRLFYDGLGKPQSGTLSAWDPRSQDTVNRVHLTPPYRYRRAVLDAIPHAWSRAADKNPRKLVPITQVSGGIADPDIDIWFGSVETGYPSRRLVDAFLFELMWYLIENSVRYLREDE